MPSGIVPDISLGVNSNPAGNQPNSLATIGTVVGLQNQLAQGQNLRNQALLFQQQFAAKARAGQIIASSPDDATAQANLQKDPLVMGYMPEITGIMRANQTNLLENQHRIQDMSGTALEGVYKGLAPALADTSQFENAFARGVATIPPSVRASLKANGGVDPIQSLHDVLAPLAKNDPAAFQRQVTAGLLTALPPDHVFPMSGNVPPQMSTSAGGGSQIIGGIPTGAAGGSGVAMPSGANGLAPRGQSAQLTSTGTPSPAPPRIAGDTTPLLAPDSALPKISVGTNGLPIRDAATQKSVEQQLDRFNADQPNYDMSAQSAARLDEVKEDISTLARGGGWMTPGAGGQLRANLGNVINTISGIFNPGKEPPIDTTKQAAAQATIKETNNLGFSLAHQMFGGGREPLGIVNSAIASVPGIDNSPLGGMLVADILKAGTQWQGDQRAFKQDWIGRAHGDLTNADTTFAQQHPPTQYVQQVMDKYGLGAKGFKAPTTDTNGVLHDPVGDAYKDGLINGKIAYNEWHRLGVISDKVYNKAAADGFPDHVPGGQ